jgi:hypothetical protein
MFQFIYVVYASGYMAVRPWNREETHPPHFLKGAELRNNL